MASCSKHSKVQNIGEKKQQQPSPPHVPVTPNPMHASNTPTEEVEFGPDMIAHEMIGPVLDEVIGDKMFTNEGVQIWVNEINDQLMIRLTDSEQPFKYLIHTMVIQKSAAGLCEKCVVFVDEAADFTVSVHWTNDSVRCIIYVFAIGI